MVKFYYHVDNATTSFGMAPTSAIVDFLYSQSITQTRVSCAKWKKKIIDRWLFAKKFLNTFKCPKFYAMTGQQNRILVGVLWVQ